MNESVHCDFPGSSVLVFSGCFMKGREFPDNGEKASGDVGENTHAGILSSKFRQIQNALEGPKLAEVMENPCQGRVSGTSCAGAFPMCECNTRR